MIFNIDALTRMAEYFGPWPPSFASLGNYTHNRRDLVEFATKQIENRRKDLNGREGTVPEATLGILNEGYRSKVNIS